MGNELETPTEEKFQVMIAEKLAHPDQRPLRKALRQAVDPKRLKLIILPTEKCNFRCTYCYETYEHGAMSHEVVQGIKNLISRRVRDLEVLQLEWFGGEPLLASRQLLEISQFAKEKCDDAGCTFLPGGITTNAYFLTPQLMEKLTRVNQRGFQISLDGDIDQHDITRISASGTGTFEEIFKNLVDLSKSEFEFRITLRLHLTPNNHQSIMSLCKKLLDTVLTDHRFSIFLKPIGDWGGKHTGKISTLDTRTANERVAEISELLLSHHMNRITSHTENATPGGEFAGICYAAAGNTLVIRSTGGLAKCTIGFEDPLNNVGQLNEDGTLTLNQTTLNQWLSGLSSLDAAELACPYSTVKRKSKVIPISAV